MDNGFKDAERSWLTEPEPDDEDEFEGHNEDDRLWDREDDID